MQDLLESASVTVELTPAVLPASATLSVYSPSGSLVESPAVTVDDLSAEVATVTAQDELVLDDAAGIVAGRSYWWQGVGGLGGVVTVGEVDGDTVILTGPVPGTARAGDTISGVRCTASLTGSLLTPRGLRWQLRWRVTDADDVTHDYGETAHVVRQRFAPPVSPAEAARYVQTLYPGTDDRSVMAARWHALASSASDRVRRVASAAKWYVHLVGDYRLWCDAGLAALRIELAHQGLYPAAVDAGTYIAEQETHLARLINEAMAAGGYDEDDTGAQTVETARVGSLRLVRR